MSNFQSRAYWAKETTLPGPNQPTSYPNRRGDAGLLENTAGVTPAREYIYIYIHRSHHRAAARSPGSRSSSSTRAFSLASGLQAASEKSKCGQPVRTHAKQIPRQHMQQRQQQHWHTRRVEGASIGRGPAKQTLWAGAVPLLPGAMLME